ncbi:MAG: biotin/lipoyl-containing protein [Acetobacter aceti]|uniref:Biotin carboxyl carrier protein of acetyl-CoA carboxylase n=1 Tax=Acetobacter aceti TaxID=435 RepID=A0A1U9KJ32_ACEAC|nr:biotin/lipoyl-containing protein [Acetobacter aceti]AQS85815.1 hypothetical protein A0U92_14715 [Acetobacter aceti]
MTIDPKRAEELMARMQKLGIAELEVRQGAERYRLVRYTPSSEGEETALRHEAAPSFMVTETPAEGASTTRIVAASMHGVFYQAAGPGQTPFVNEGTTVQEGDTLYILEVMKTLSRVEAEFPCRIIEIMVRDGQPVEPGMPLFTVEAANA